MVASKVHGPMTARDVRVVWADGQLYVCKSPTDIAVFTSPEPKKRAGMYQAEIGEGVLRFQPATCGSCRQRVMKSPVGQMSVADIVAAGSLIEA